VATVAPTTVATSVTDTAPAASETSASDTAPIDTAPIDTAGSETTVAETGSVDSTVQGVVALATADLTSHLGLAASAVTVLSAKAMTWPDGSLGCPKPGIMYTQVQVDGALIELQAGGKTYSYHSGSGGKPTLCEQALSGQAIPPSTS
jgi:hypothetical protein